MVMCSPRTGSQGDRFDIGYEHRTQIRSALILQLPGRSSRALIPSNLSDDSLEGITCVLLIHGPRMSGWVHGSRWTPGATGRSLSRRHKPEPETIGTPLRGPEGGSARLQARLRGASRPTSRRERVLGDLPYRPLRGIVVCRFLDSMSVPKDGSVLDASGHERDIVGEFAGGHFVDIDVLEDLVDSDLTGDNIGSLVSSVRPEYLLDRFEAVDQIIRSVPGCFQCVGQNVVDTGRRILAIGLWPPFWDWSGYWQAERTAACAKPDRNSNKAGQPIMAGGLHS